MISFIKLSSLINEDFTVERIQGHKWKQWDNQQGKMLVSDTPQKGFRKLYQVETNAGILDLGSGQIGSLLEAVFEQGKADLINKTFHVKSNGKSGMEIRYFFSVVKPDEYAEEDFGDYQ